MELYVYVEKFYDVFLVYVVLVLLLKEKIDLFCID